MAQDPFATTFLPHVFVWEKAVDPVMLMLAIMRVVLPVLVSVVVWGGGQVSVGPLLVQEKVRVGGTNSTVGEMIEISAPADLVVSVTEVAVSVSSGFDGTVAGAV
jgi:hypothetical protein